jgi:hypothetical protein
MVYDDDHDVGYIVMLSLLLLVMPPPPPSPPILQRLGPDQAFGAGRRHRGLGRIETPRGFHGTDTAFQPLAQSRPRPGS